MQRSLGVWPALAAIASAASFVACGMPIGPFKAEARDTWTHSYTLGKNGEISIANVNGRVEIEGTDATTVEVDAERIAHGATDQLARDLLPKIVINDQSTFDVVQIETGRMQGLLIGTSFEVRYHVKAPRNIAVRASTVNGGVEVRGVGGRVVAHTTNGGIVATDCSGALEARTVNGGIRAQLVSVGLHDVTLGTVNGGVRLSLPHSAKATVNATWVNGGFNSGGLPFEIRVNGKRHFEGLLNGGGTAINLNTVNGGIRVSTAAQSVDADTDGPTLKEHVAP